MKKTVIWVLQHLVITVALFMVTEIPQGIKLINDISNKRAHDKKFTRQELASLEMNPATVVHYTDSLINTRKMQLKGMGIYDPYLYFHDLKQFEIFKFVYYDSLMKSDVAARMLCNDYTNLAAGGKYAALINLSVNSWRDNDPTTRHIFAYLEQTGYLQRTMTLDEAREYWYPDKVAQERIDAKKPPINFLTEIIVPVLQWALRFYLKGLPFAALLFLIWKMKLRQELLEEAWPMTEIAESAEKFRFQPLSFIVSILLWPIVLWIDLKNRLSNLMRRAEVLSRRNTMLSLLSESDQKLIEFGKTVSLAEFRDHLDAIGMTRKHSFASAMIVTMFVIVVPRTIIAAIPVVEITHQHVLITHTDYGGTHYKNSFSTPPTIHHYEVPDLQYLVSEIITKTTDSIFYYFQFQAKLLDGFLRSIDGVPRILNQPILELI